MMAKNEVISEIYFGANGARVGGYTIRTDDTMGSADFVNWEDLIKLAKENSFKWVHLAGDWQKEDFAHLGYKGMGQRIPLATMTKIINQDQVVQYRTRVK